MPVWLHYIPGTVFRTNNAPFKVKGWLASSVVIFSVLGDNPSDILWMQSHMKSFTMKIVDMMKNEQFFEIGRAHV